MSDEHQAKSMTRALNDALLEDSCKFMSLTIVGMDLIVVAQAIGLRWP